MQQDEPSSTRFIFDGNTVQISPNLRPIVTFLQAIEEELKIFTEPHKKLNSIRDSVLELFKFIQYLAEILEKNKIRFEYKLPRKTINIGDQFYSDKSLRAEMIVLFANLETYLCIHLAYKHKTSSKSEIIRLQLKSTNEVIDFYNKYCLGAENEWVKNNQDRATRISAKELRDLRNSLTHFFSLDQGLGITYEENGVKARELETRTNFKAKFISPKDLSEILKGCFFLMMKDWTKDYQTSAQKRDDIFKEKIMCVREVVLKHGAVIIEERKP